MIGVSPGTGVSHLYEFTRHIHTYKIVIPAVLFKEGVDLFCRTRCDFSIFITPVWKDFAFIRLDHQYALLTPAHLIPFGMFAKINIGKILLIIKGASQSGTIVKIVLTIVGRIRGSRHPACFPRPKQKTPYLTVRGFSCLMPGSSLLSHGETPHYHRRYGVSLLSSAWGQVGPPR